jgi:spore maturation protein SpmA
VLTGGTVLNWIWLGLILIAVLFGAWTGRMEAVQDAAFASAKSAVSLVISMTGFMIFMLGLMEVAKQGGLLRFIARTLAPVLKRLFPDIPPDHPAMGAMVMNMASNVLGLGNAATPFGLKAMEELDRLNRRPGIASDSMVLFLAINTSSITLMMPTGTMVIRDQAGSADPAAIWLPTLIATTCSTIAAISAFYLLRRRKRFALPPESADADTPIEAVAADAPAESGTGSENFDLADNGTAAPPSPARRIVIWGFIAALALGLGLEVHTLLADHSLLDTVKIISKDWLVPMLIAALLLVGFAAGVRVYEAMIVGAKEGLGVVVRIIPYLVGILVAVGMFRASGAMDLIIRALDPLTSPLGFPAEALPMALLRPLSGSGALGIMVETFETHGPDSFVGMLVSTLQGSTETTFYVLTLYAGAGRVSELRHALPACLIGDLGGVIGATVACHLFFG